MRLFRNVFLLLTAVCFALNGIAQGVEDPAHWSFEVKGKGNNTYDLIFHAQLDKDWHIFSMDPGGDGLQTKTEFEFDKNPIIKLVGKVRESGKVISGPMAGVDGVVNYFENRVDFIQTVKVTGNTAITGKFYFGACDHNHCLSPSKRKFTFTIFDVKGDSAVGIITPTDTQQTASTTTTNTGGTDSTLNSGTSKAGTPTTNGSQTLTPSTSESCDIMANLVPGIGWGLASVVTPCVFAMLPMTVSFFLKRSKDRKTGIKIAFQYSLSIVFIFAIIGGLSSLLLGPDAIHAFSTNWIVNIGFFVIFVIFGISFLGAFEISLPSSWATKMDSKANTQNLLGIFFMALTLVIVSFSCTAPFIGNIVVALKGGCKIAPLMGFLGFGIGLALPFTLFAIFPSLLNELGKSGGWLNAVKVVFGFVEIALAMKFLSNADLQRNWRLLDREIFIAIWMGLSFVLGFYLLGFIRFSHDSELPKNDWGLNYLKVPRLFFALAAIIFGLYLLPGMWGAPLNGMGAFIPPMGTQDFVVPTGEAGSAPASETGDGPKPVKYVSEMKRFEPAAVLSFHITTFYDYAEALEASRKSKKPVMLDFTGINCANCRKFEAEVWSKPAVLAIMKNDFIIASLFTDVQGVELPKAEQRYSEAASRDIETLGDKNVDLQITKFASNTQPFYFFVDENGTLLADKGISYPYAPEAFVQHLETVKARYKELHP